MKRWLIALFFAACMLVGSARADVEAGLNVFSISGNLTSANYQDSGSADLGCLSFGAGHFFANEMEMGFQAMGNWSENLDLYGFGGYYKYHLTPKLTTIPYVGVQLNYEFYNTFQRDGEGIMYGPLAGIKYFVSRSVSVFFEYQYQMYNGDIEDFVEDANSLYFGVLFTYR